MQTPNTPSSAISATSSSGISASARCQACASGAMRSSANCAELARGPCPASRRRALSSGRQPSAKQLRQGCAGRRRCCRGAGTSATAGSAAQRPRRVIGSARSDGRTISFWPIGRPPCSWARYSPKPICRTKRLALAEAARGPGAPPRRRAAPAPRRWWRSRRSRARGAALSRHGPGRPGRPRRRPGGIPAALPASSAAPRRVPHWPG